MGAPTSTNCIKGPGTSPNSFNCLFKYNIGAGPLPWNHSPDYAYTVGLDGIATLRPEVDIGKDGKIIAGFGRANGSNPDVQILDPSGSNLLWTSWNEIGTALNPPFDPWAGILTGSPAAPGGTYSGVRVSPDGVYFASVDVNNGITIANLTNGIPDDGSIFQVPNLSTTVNSRGMCWDAADNIWVASSGQGLLRCYSLGITTTCVTSNDFSGTNGSFAFTKPGAAASAIATTPTASQNYINNTNVGFGPGTPIPGVFTISLNVNSNPGPVAVSFVLGGTGFFNQGATNVGAVTNFTMNLGVNGDGVTITSNSVTFPAGLWPHAGNWSVDVMIIPTAVPVTGPTLSVTLKVLGGTNYSAGSPVNGSLSILNTGPQMLALSAASGAANMSRAVPGDYASFIITRTGDLQGPGNGTNGVTPKPYTVTNYNYYGTAAYPLDYGAQAQVLFPTPPYGNLSSPTNGGNAVVINPGVVSLTNIVGNPIKHTNPAQAPTNINIIVNITNKTGVAATALSATSSEGYAYTVATAAVTLN